MEDIYTHIANLGFPIVISIYLLVRIEGKLNQLTDSIIELSKVISKQNKTIV
ncbi:MAG TPA: YvrJ family protein [Tissierellaceae bacterium]|nr:YvrJ family protein [Tissierellaceae bacterium]